MHTPTLSVTDRTSAEPAVDYILARLAVFDTRLLEWIRIYPMTANQHEPLLSGDCPPATLSNCWLPRERHPGQGTRLPRHMYRIKVNIWLDGDYPATERGWGRVPARLLQQRNPAKGLTTRGLCEWCYPDRLSATVHALARAIFVFLADTRQLEQNPSKSNASAWGHKWTIAWLKQNGQLDAAAALSAQLVQWTLIQGKSI
ncbi:MAG: hypothetical protein PVH38_08565 [Gammaproteobacteria bacterium]|jgi:hypothetical protein